MIMTILIQTNRTLVQISISLTLLKANYVSTAFDLIDFWEGENIISIINFVYLIVEPTLCMTLC